MITCQTVPTMAKRKKTEVRAMKAMVMLLLCLRVCWMKPKSLSNLVVSIA